MAREKAAGRGKRTYMISAVSKRFNVHPQTLRLYERDGLITPSRTDGNTRVYTDEDIERLEVILNLTRNLGVNLAGVEVVLNMRDKMAVMQTEMKAFMKFFMEEMQRVGIPREEIRERAIVKAGSSSLQVLIEREEGGDGAQG